MWEIELREDILTDLVKASNCLFKNLKSEGWISGKYLKKFIFKFNKIASLGKLYILPKNHKRLFDVPGRPVISNCGAATEKVAEYRRCGMILS